ncbi:MAG: hypothetical protein NC124_18770, partial [Clostridium sp.]|nr:hypothetical protein [Clostridium sp.]
AFLVITITVKYLQQNVLARCRRKANAENMFYSTRRINMSEANCGKIFYTQNAAVWAQLFSVRLDIHF